MFQERICHISNRAEFIRFSEAFFEAIPVELFRDPTQHFKAFIFGDERSGKSLIAHAAFYALHDDRSLAWLLSMPPSERPTVENDILKPVHNYALHIEQPFTNAVNGQAVSFSYTESSPNWWVEEHYSRAQDAMPNGGLSFVSTTLFRRRALPDCTVAFEVLKNKSSIDEHEKDKKENVRALRGSIPLTGVWTEKAGADPSADEDFPRLIAIYINKNDRLGKKLLKDEAFHAFWTNSFSPKPGSSERKKWGSFFRFE